MKVKNCCFIMFLFLGFISCDGGSSGSNKEDSASIVGKWCAVTGGDFPQSATVDLNGNGTQDVSYTKNLYWVADVTFIDVYHTVENPTLLTGEITQEKANQLIDTDFTETKPVTISEANNTITYSDSSVVTYTVSDTTLVINPGLANEATYTRVTALPGE